MTFPNALSKDFGFSNAPTSRAVSTKRVWRSASVSLGFLPADFFEAISLLRKRSFATKFADRSRQFENISQKHFREKSQGLGVALFKFIRIMKRCIALNANMIGPRPHVRCDAMVFMQPLQPIIKRALWNAIHSFRRDIQRRAIHSDRAVPFRSRESVLALKESLPDRRRRVRWRAQCRLARPNSVNCPKYSDVTVKRDRRSASVCMYCRCFKTNRTATCPAQSCAIPEIVVREILFSLTPFDVKCDVLSGAMWAVSSDYSHAA